MLLKLLVLFLTSLFLLNSTMELPDFGINDVLRALDIRQRLEKSTQGKNQLNLFINSTTDVVYLDGVAHFKVNSKFRDAKKVEEIEDEFRKLIGMVGVKYLYKRDTSWRTWRQVEYPDGERVVCYRCSNVVNATCPKCNSGGFWIIEDHPPPCPYEIFYMIDENRLCAAKYTQFVNINETCPSEIEFNDLSSCDNPIVTKYQITEAFDKVELLGALNHICEGQKYCEITTFYRIYKDYIIFRIGNSKNIVIFSKIMKSGGKKFVCLNNCGHVDSMAKKLTVNDNPVSFDLLPSRKNKRENKNTGINKTVTKGAKAKRIGLNNIRTDHKNKHTSVSPCKKIQTTEDYENDSYDYRDVDEDAEN